MKKTILSVAILALSVGALAPAAIAQTAETNTRNGAVVDSSGNGTADNAAAAVLVEYDQKGNVVSLSAASAFGGNGAAALATPLGSTAVGTSASSGSLMMGVPGQGSAGLSIEFGEQDMKYMNYSTVN